LGEPCPQVSPQDIGSPILEAGLPSIKVLPAPDATDLDGVGWTTIPQT
jgi:hypothetical protein